LVLKGERAVLQENSMATTGRSWNGRQTSINVNWLRVLDAYRVRFLVLNLESEGDMVSFFRSQSEWSIDFEDEESIIFARSEADQMHGRRDWSLRGLRDAA
jgi:hypothetical protein